MFILRCNKIYLQVFSVFLSLAKHTLQQGEWKNSKIPKSNSAKASIFTLYFHNAKLPRSYKY